MTDNSENITPADMREQAEEVYEQSWEIHYNNAQCKFESTSEEDAVLYDLEVPENARNKGIGTAMVEAAEQILLQSTDINILYAQIGASDGATIYVLENKCGFEVIGVDERETLGKIIDARKRIR